MQEDVLFCGSFSAQPSLVRRLVDEFKEATREFRENPKQYITGAIKGDGAGSLRRKSLFRLGLAIAIMLYAIIFAAMLVLWALNAKQTTVANKNREITVLNLPSYKMQDDSMPISEKEANGGGGGGKKELTPASQGEPPLFSSIFPIIAPTTRPTINPPVLPVDERLLGDPAQNIKRDEFVPTGLPDGVPGAPSDGPGTNGGIGDGKDGGAGPGEGQGFGPGKDGGKGGGINNGPSGGRPDSDAQIVVDAKPVLLNEPRPNYTEEARKNKVQGVVRARVLIGSNGLIKQVRIIRGLPDGLNEEAIRAAMQIRFKPAMKSGQAVSYWTSLDVEFNLR
jgi:TonB family protein